MKSADAHAGIGPGPSAALSVPRPRPNEEPLLTPAEGTVLIWGPPTHAHLEERRRSEEQPLPFTSWPEAKSRLAVSSEAGRARRYRTGNPERLSAFNPNPSPRALFGVRCRFKLPGISNGELHKFRRSPRRTDPNRRFLSHDMSGPRQDHIFWYRLRDNKLRIIREPPNEDPATQLPTILTSSAPHAFAASPP